MRHLGLKVYKNHILVNLTHLIFLSVSTLGAFVANAADADMTQGEMTNALLNNQALMATSDNNARLNTVFMNAPSLAASLKTSKAVDFARFEIEKRVAERAKQLLLKSNNMVDPSPAATYGSSVTDIPFAQLNVSNLLGDDDLKKENADLDQMLTLLTVGFPEMRPDSKFVSPESAQEFVNFVKKDARGSVAQYSMSMIRATHELGDNNAKSLMAALEAESLGRLAGAKSDWFATLSTVPKEALVRELNHIKAARLYLKYQQYLQNERIEALLATKLALDVDMKDIYEAMQQAVKTTLPGG